MSERRFRVADDPVRQIIFVLTDECNLDCVYCYEKHKNTNGRKLPASVIRAKIEREMLAKNDVKTLWFIFFGGEPLLCFDTIRDTLTWFEATEWPRVDKQVHFMVETNGTLLNDEMKAWFTERRDHVTLSISLDGTKEAHDRNRSNSFDAVARHFGFFRQNWPNQPVKMTIGPDTLDQTYEGVRYLHSEGFQATFDVVFEDVWGDRRSERRAVGVWADQLDKLVHYYAANPDLPRPRVLSRKLERLFDPPSAESYTFCSAGQYVTSFLPDQREYPCFRFAPLVVDQPLENVLTDAGADSQQCQLCPFERICTTCEGHNYEVTGSPFVRTRFHCKFFKVSLLASAKMMLIDRGRDLLDGGSDDAETTENQMRRLRTLLAIRVVNDVCGPLVDWATSTTAEQRQIQ
jgi:uncharacterized protein